MLKQFKSVSMILLLMGTTGAAYAATYPGIADVQIAQQTDNCTGVVKDATGETVIGASVVVKGTTNGTITGFDGDFSLPNVKKGDVIQISFIGYTTKEVVWNGQPLNVTLKEDTKTLEEVVVVGYGTQKKVNVTGAVSQVGAEALASRPVQNASQALQGQIPGLTMSVGNGGGALDADLGISIRGGGTIGSGSSGSPLVLIDGIEGNMNTVNPNDIENVSVLKDAASASIYGARAAFGVILITTKSGKEGKTKVNYSGNVRFSTAIQIPEMVNSIDFANYYNVSSINGGGTPIFSEENLENMRKYQTGGFTDPSQPEYWGTTVNNNNRYNAYTGSHANTNWFDEFYKKGVPSHEHNLSISGGNEKLTYVLSANFLDQKGLLRHGEDNFNRYTLNAKISAKLTDWAKMNFTSKWTRDEYDRPTYMTGLFFHNIARRWPTCPAVDPHGHAFPNMEIIQMEEGGEQTRQRDWYTNQLQFVFEPIKDWHITVDGSMRHHTSKSQWAVLPIYGYDADNNPYLLSWNGGAAGYSEARKSTGDEDYFSTNIFTDYSKTIKGHYFKTMVGFNAELYKNSDLWGFGTGLITPTVPELGTTQKDQKTGNGASELALAGFFGRLNYNYQERYILEANIRYDGSSRFLGNNRWGWFPSFSAGWNIAREAFFEPLSGTISSFKLRGSWGELGNNNLNARYPFYQGMPTGVANSGWLIGGVKPNTAGLPGITSDLLTWETIQSWDVGFDWAAFNNRFTGSFSYYNRLTKDMVAASPKLPGILGTSSPKLNNADLKSYGWELELSWKDRIKDVKYGVRVVLDDNQEKITKFYNPSGDLGQFYDGRMMGDIWGYTTVGIAQTQQEMNDHLKNNRPTWGGNWAAGDIMFKDLNGDGKIDGGANNLEDHGDKTIIGNNKPRYKFGISLDAEWKGIDLAIFLQGVMKRDYWLGGPYFWGADGGMWQSACFKEHLDYWSPENTGAYYPRPTFGDNKNHQVQTGYLQSAAYMRLKNIQLGYTLPKAWMNKVGVESLRVYVSGDNLLTFSSISKVFDPETLGGDRGEGKLYPLQRTISVGLNVNF